MRNFDREREKIKAVRTYETPTGATVTVAGVVSHYNALLAALEEAVKETVNAHNRKAWQEVAWRLGMKGETHACEVIMKHAKEPSTYPPAG